MYYSFIVQSSLSEHGYSILRRQVKKEKEKFEYSKKIHAQKY
jgi:hypothetical protein